MIDYLELKHISNSKERRLHEENELLRIENSQLRKEMEKVIENANMHTENTEHEYEKRSTQVLGKYRKQNQLQEENIQIIKVCLYEHTGFNMELGTISEDSADLFSQN